MIHCEGSDRERLGTDASFACSEGIELLRFDRGVYHSLSSNFVGSRWRLMIRNIMATTMTLKKIEGCLILHGKDNKKRYSNIRKLEFRDIK